MRMIPSRSHPCASSYTAVLRSGQLSAGDAVPLGERRSLFGRYDRARPGETFQRGRATRAAGAGGGFEPIGTPWARLSVLDGPPPILHRPGDRLIAEPAAETRTLSLSTHSWLPPWRQTYERHHPPIRSAALWRGRRPAANARGVAIEIAVELRSGASPLQD
jgi:hypothetical protein